MLMSSQRVKLFASALLLNTLMVFYRAFNPLALLASIGGGLLSPAFLIHNSMFIGVFMAALTVITAATALWVGIKYSESTDIGQHMPSILIDLVVANIFATLIIVVLGNTYRGAIFMALTYWLMVAWTPSAVAILLTGMMLGTIHMGGRPTVFHLVPSLTVIVALYQAWRILRTLAGAFLITMNMFSLRTTTTLSALSVAGLIIYPIYLIALLIKGRTINLAEDYPNILYTLLTLDIATSVTIELATAAIYQQGILQTVNQIIIESIWTILRAFGAGFASISLGYLWSHRATEISSLVAKEA